MNVSSNVLCVECGGETRYLPRRVIEVIWRDVKSKWWIDAVNSKPRVELAESGVLSPEVDGTERYDLEVWESGEVRGYSGDPRLISIVAGDLKFLY